MDSSSHEKELNSPFVSVDDNNDEENEHRRRLRNEGDRYHMSVCRCDLTNTCIQDVEALMTLQTELFLCFETSQEEIQIDQVSSLSLKGNAAELNRIVDGSPMDSKTWYTCEGRACVVRTRLESKFVTKIMPTRKKILLVAQGEAILHKVNERKKQAGSKHHARGANITDRFLLVNVTTPFEVEIWVKPTESPAVTHSWVILVVAVLFICICNIFCEMSMEGRRRRNQLEQQQNLDKQRSQRAMEIRKRNQKRKSKKNAFQDELASAFDNDGVMDEISLMDSSVDNFVDEISSLDGSDSSYDSRKARAHIARV